MLLTISLSTGFLIALAWALALGVIAMWVALRPEKDCRVLYRNGHWSQPLTKAEAEFLAKQVDGIVVWSPEPRNYHRD